MDLLQKLHAQRSYFDSGTTKEITFRKAQLRKLKEAVVAHEEQIFAALHKDLKKSREECWITENGFFLSELNYAIANVEKWAKPKRVKTNLANLPSQSYIMPEPLGVALIISPWNYPFQLLLTPLVGAIAAGNCVVLKPSEFAPATAAVIKKIISETFEEQYILLIEGDGAEVIPSMMEHFIFDHVFYTGSTFVGQKIYELAAKNLVPVTLELGGKTPCVVEADADIKIAAKRIAFPKFSNCGQMCVSPDYVLVHESKKEELVAELKNAIQQFFKGSPQQSEDYGRIINEKQFNRLIKYIADGKLLLGGKYDKADLFIEPTILDGVSLDSNMMKEEIFGPILPVLTFQNREEALHIIAKNKNPLAFYIFSGSRRNADEWIKAVPSGGSCVNNAALHLTNHNLPFGGRGFSGTGAYHGKKSFDTFSHQKAVLKTPTWIDPYIKYPPYKGRLGILKKLIG